MSEEKHSLRERLAPMLPKFLMILGRTGSV